MHSGASEAEERLAQQNQYLAALHELTLGLLDELDLERLLEEIIDRATELSSTEHAFVDVVDPAQGAMQLRVAKGNFRSQLGVWTRPNEGISGRVLAMGLTLISEDYAQYAGKLPGYEWLRTIIAVPLRSGTTVLGVIGLGYDEVSTPHADHISFLNQFATLASIALKNAQLYQNVQAELTERKRLEDELRETQDHLEEIVMDRTSELIESNILLQQEIEERQRMEDALRTNEEKYRLLVQNAPVGIVSIDNEGWLLSINPAARRMLGTPEGPVQQGSSNLLLHPTLTNTQIIKDLQQCLNEGAALVNEQMYRTAWGREVYLRYHVAPTHDGQGRISGLQVLFEDITDRKKAEQAQDAAYKQLQDLNYLKDEFIVNVSHELRTPITNLKVYHLLLDRKPEHIGEYISKLNAETRRLEGVVDGILTISEIKEELRSRSFQPLDLQTLIIDLAQDYEIRAASRDLTLSLTATEAGSVYGDARLLRRVLMILLDNSLNYTPAGGDIHLSLQSKLDADQRWIGFAVGNTGPQIPADELPRVFDRFFRGKIAVVTGQPGAGLGLAIAKEIIETHQGLIEIINEDGGAVNMAFHVWLPAESKSEPEVQVDQLPTGR